MFLRKLMVLDSITVKNIRNLRLNTTYPNKTLYFLCKYLKIEEYEAKYLQIKHPILNKITERNIKSLLETLNELGYSNKVLISNPSLYSLVPITIKFRHKVLQECGMEPVTPENLLNYINIIKRKTIGELKSNGCIPSHLNVENRLASFMTQWPTSLTTLIYGDVNTLSLYSLRLKIIQRYLELLLDINSDEFNRGLQTYPTIKHRPLEVINEVLKILQSEIMMPNQKIKANLFLIHADSENLRNLIYNFRFIGGIDIKEVIRLHPRIAMRKYQTMLEIKNILQEFKISKEAQTRCFEIYTLSPATIRERLEKAKNTPDFITYFEHPRFLKIIYYNKTATKRLLNLYNSRKNCVSLNVLSSSNSHYEAFQKAPGDCFGKGKDTVFFIHQILQNAYTARDIRNSLKKHPFWINVPLIQMKFVADLLLKKFSAQDIFDNCFILLYPWKKICDVMYILNSEEVHQLLPFDHLDLSKITNSQKLSLMLYLLEKNHYFSGNGVWIESKNKNSEIADQNESNYYLK